MAQTLAEGPVDCGRRRQGHITDYATENSSAGKDSQALLDVVVGQAKEQGALGRVVVLHCDLGLSPGGEPIEWPGTLDLAREHAVYYGLRFLVCQRQVRGFLEEVLDRGLWMSNGQRYCTSYFLCGPPHNTSSATRARRS